MKRPRKLPPEEIMLLLQELTEWQMEGNMIKREFRFQSYKAGIAFVNAVAHEADERDHHPELLVNWRRVEVRLTTHSEQGVTMLDLNLAREVNRIASPQLESP